MLALQLGSVGSVLGGTDSETVLVVRDKAHPLHVPYILACNTGGGITTDGVTDVLGSPRVELSSGITVGNVDLGTVPEPVDLDVKGGLDVMSSSDDAVRDQPGVVTGLGAVGDDDGLDVPDQAIRSWLRRTPKAEIIDTVQRDQPRVGSLVYI